MSDKGVFKKDGKVVFRMSLEEAREFERKLGFWPDREFSMPNPTVVYELELEQAKALAEFMGNYVGATGELIDEVKAEVDR